MFEVNNSQNSPMNAILKILDLQDSAGNGMEGAKTRPDHVSSQNSDTDYPRVLAEVSDPKSESSRFLMQTDKKPHLAPSLLAAVHNNHLPASDNLVFRVAWDSSLDETSPPRHQSASAPVDGWLEGVVERILGLQVWRQFEFKKQTKVQADPVPSAKASEEEDSGTEVLEFENPQQQKVEVLVKKAIESKRASVIFQKYLEQYRPSDVAYLTIALKELVPQLIVHAFGSYILQKLCMLSPTFKQFVIDYCFKNLLQLSSNEYSSRVMQILAENIASFRRCLFKDAAENFTVAMRSMSWVLLLSACVRAAQSSDEYEDLLTKMTSNPQQRTDSKTYFFKLVVSVVRVCSPQSLSRIYHAFRSILTSHSLFSSKNRLLILSSILNRKHPIAVQDFDRALQQTDSPQMILDSPHVTYFIDKLTREESVPDYHASPLGILYRWLHHKQNRVLTSRSLGSVLDPRSNHHKLADRATHFYAYILALTSPPRMFEKLQNLRKLKPVGQTGHTKN